MQIVKTTVSRRQQFISLMEIDRNTFLWNGEILRVTLESQGIVSKSQHYGSDVLMENRFKLIKSR